MLANEREWRPLWQWALVHALGHVSQPEYACRPEPFGCDDDGCCEYVHYMEHGRQCVHCERVSMTEPLNERKKKTTKKRKRVRTIRLR